MKKFKKWSPLIIFIVFAAAISLQPTISALTSEVGAFKKQIGYDSSFDLKKTQVNSPEEIDFVEAKLLPSSPEPTFYVFVFSGITSTIYYVSNVKISEKDPESMLMAHPYPIKTGSAELFDATMDEINTKEFNIRYSSNDVTIYEKTYDGKEFSLGGITYRPEYFKYGNPISIRS